MLDAAIPLFVIGNPMLPVLVPVLLRKKSKPKGVPTTLMSDEKLDHAGRRWVDALSAVCLFFGLGYLYTPLAA
jgi:hypothetical protein